jgi:hypothetical protein
MLEERVKQLEKQAREDFRYNESLMARLVQFLRKEAVEKEADEKEAVKKEVDEKEAAEKEAVEKEVDEKEAAEKENNDDEED